MKQVCSWVFGVVLAAAGALGCDGAPRCVEGTTQACACPGGSSGVQTCTAAGSFGACDCGDTPDGGMDGAIGDGGMPDGGMMVGTGETVTMMVGPEGGEIELTNATLTIPSGAVSTAIEITVTETTTSTPAGYRAFSPLYRFEPEGLEFAVPATVAIRSRAADADVPLGTLFWSRAAVDGGGWERRGGIPTGGEVVGEVEHFSLGFIADGVDYTEAPDTSCVRTRVLDTRRLLPSGVGLFFAMDDCWGRPITDLTDAEIEVFEDDAALSSEATATLFEQRGLQVFVTLAMDVSASTRPVQAQLVAAARRFVETLNDPARGLQGRVQVGILGFAGEASAGFVQAHTLDLDRVLARLDELATYVPSDSSSTNLNGAAVEAMTASQNAQASFRSRNHGGAFSAGYVVLFTDGTDTAGRVTREAANTAIVAGVDDVVAVGLRGDDYDPAALRLLFATTDDPAGATAPVIDADDVTVLDRDFAYLAARVAGQVRRSYLLGYCSPKRSGLHTVYVGHADATEPTRVWGMTPRFDATGFTGGCGTAMFDPAEICGGECGGFGCGACDDRVAACEAGSSPTRPGACISYCVSANRCTGETITNPLGYEQVCPESPEATRCGSQCTSLLSDAYNCGECGHRCSVDCGGGACVDATDVSITQYGGCAVTALGGLRCWGGALRVPSERAITDAVEVAVGYGSTENAFACVRRRDGTVWCWRQAASSDYLVTDLSGVTALSADVDDRVCALLTDRTVRCGRASSATWSAVPGLSDVVELSLPCARRGDGSVWCWGTPYGPTPVSVLRVGETALRISRNAALLMDGSVRSYPMAGGVGGEIYADPGSFGADVDEFFPSFQTVFARRGGAIWVRGRGLSGVIGDGRRYSGTSSFALREMLPAGATSLSGAGVALCVAVAGDGVRCLNYSESAGAAADDVASAERYSIAETPLGTARSVAGNVYVSCIVTDDGRLWCWGSALSNPGLGFSRVISGGVEIQLAALAEEVPGISGARAVRLSGQNGYLVMEDGTARAWGDNFYGTVGDGTTSSRTSPVAISGLAGVTDIAAAGSHACSLHSDGSVRCWGRNLRGELGDGTTTDRSIPVVVTGLTGVTRLVAASDHNCALLGDGTLRCWGANGSRQLGDGTTTDRSSPVAAMGITGVRDLVVGRDDRIWVALGDGSLRSITSPSAAALGVMRFLGTLSTSVGGAVLVYENAAGATRCSDGTRDYDCAIFGFAGSWQSFGGVCGIDDTGAARCVGDASSTQPGDGRLWRPPSAVRASRR